MRPFKFRPEMISNLLQAAESMRDSPLASDLKLHGLDPATMAEHAERLCDLRTRATLAREAAVEATQHLGECAREIATTYARYCNLVRGLTTDPGLRRVHGVKSPGIRKGPSFRRGAPENEG
jgi:hypothetical protein